MLVTLNSISSTTDVIVKSGNSSDLKRTGSEIDKLSNFTSPCISSFQEIGLSSNFNLQCGDLPFEIKRDISFLFNFSEDLS